MNSVVLPTGPLGHVVVLGAGFAGMLAAAAVAPHAEQVTVVERDTIGGDPTPRRGVPQSTQLHNLLTPALSNMESLLPGSVDLLHELGAARAAVASQTTVFELGRRMPERDLGLQLMSAPRPLIDHVVHRELCRQHPNVSFRCGVSATGMRVAEGQQISVELRSAEFGRNDAFELSAAIVVDALGVGSSVERWLPSESGRPEMDELDVGQWYATCHFRRDARSANDWFWMVFPEPGGTRGALLSPGPAGTWYASVSGRRGDSPPRTSEELVGHAQNLSDPIIGELLADAEPLGAPTVFRKTKATWRRFDRWDAHPVGLLPIGDAFASLNPLYGQGLSVAAWEASCLRAELDAGHFDPLSLTRRYLASAARCVDRAWRLGALATAAPTDEAIVEMGRLAGLVADDPEVHRRYVGVWHLLEDLSELDTMTPQPTTAGPGSE